MRTLMLKDFLIVILLVLAIMALLFFTKSPFLRTSYEHTIVGDPSDSFLRGQLEEELLPLYDGVETLVLFIGYARSGHSLVGAILDSHPEIIIPHEFDIISNWNNYRSEGIGESDEAKYRLFFDLDTSSQFQAMFGIRASSCTQEKVGNLHYCYNVPDSWHGTYKDKIKVIGETLLQKPRHFPVLDKIQRTVKVPIKFIHVIRNPFDNIATKLVRSLDLRGLVRDGVLEEKANNSTALDYFITRYFELVRAVNTVHQRPDYNVLDIYSRDMVHKPKETIHKLCDFLGVSCYEEFVNKAMKLLYSGPPVTRYSVEWTSQQKQRIVNEMKEYPFLRSFTFAED